MKNKITKVTCQDIEGKKYEISPDELSFRPAVYGVIIKDEKILLAREWDGYDFPGGAIELGENTEDALVREVKEETGLNVDVDQLLYCNNAFFKLPFKGNFVHSIHMYYKCTFIGGELSTEFFDEQEKIYSSKAEWVELKKIPKIKFYSSVDAMKVLQNLL